MHRTLTFQNQKVDEGEFDENDEPTVPPGRSLSSHLASVLETHVDWVRDFTQHSYYGWAFDSCFKGHKFFNVTNPTESEVYLTVKMDWYGLKSLISNRPRNVFDEYCDLLSSVVAKLEGTTSQEWEDYAS